MMKMEERASRIRLNMRVPADLLQWAKRYVRYRHTNITQLFIDHLMKLKEKSGASNGKTS